jgi:hypothetical protein
MTVDKNKRPVERDPKADYGDNLTPEQIAAAAAVEGEDGDLTDKQVAAALAAMETGAKDDDPPSGDPAKDDKGDPAGDDGTGTGEPEEKGKTIPKGRFDKAVKKERDRAEAAEKELADLKRDSRKERRQSSEPKQPTFADAINTATKAVAESRKAWQKALLDNDETNATTALDAMTAAEIKLDDLKLDQSSQVTRQQTTEDVNYNSALDALEKEYPQINEDSDDFDEKLLSKVARLHTGLVRGGMSRVNALEEAVELYLTPLKPKAKDPKEVKDTLRDKAKGALAKTVADQPPDTGDVGHVDTKGVTLKVSRMTRKQFDNLPEAQLSVLRGDTV